jgi:hypothetical protein
LKQSKRIGLEERHARNVDRSAVSRRQRDSPAEGMTDWMYLTAGAKGNLLDDPYLVPHVEIVARSGLDGCSISAKAGANHPAGWNQQFLDLPPGGMRAVGTGNEQHSRAGARLDVVDAAHARALAQCAVMTSAAHRGATFP